MAMSTIYSIKKGFWQKSKKDIKENLNLNKLVEYLVRKLNVTTFNKCCDTDSLVRPAQFNLETGVMEWFNGETYVTTAGMTPNNITAGTGGAISVVNYLTTINTDAGGDAFTLADGTYTNQMKRINLVVDGGGNAVITVTSGDDYNTITMNDAGDYVILQWSGSVWKIKTNFGATVA